MADTTKEGRFAGSRCTAGPGHSWGLATIRTVHPDGTCTIEFDTKDMVLMKYWYGVTPSECSFEDAAQWPAVHAELSPGGAAVDADGFSAILRRLGYDSPVEAIRGFWKTSCLEALKIPAGEVEAYRADASAVYALMLRLRQCAKSVRDILHPPAKPQLLKLYWNQTRMGGRDPEELSRVVTLGDAFAALGVDAKREDREGIKAVREYEARSGVVLPETLRTFATRTGIADAVIGSHPNNPAFVPPSQWEPLSGLRANGADGDRGVVIVTPHQGDHEWVAVFDAGDSDARIWLRRCDDTDWAITAPSLPLFFWDLAQTGLGWYQDTNFEGGKPVTTNDLGYIPK